MLYFPQLDRHAIPPVVLNASFLTDHHEGWMELGKQLAPLSLSLSFAHRDLVLRPDLAASPALLQALWAAVDRALATLDQAEAVVATLRPLKTDGQTAARRYDLDALVNGYRWDAVRVDLLAHERVVEAVEGCVEAGGEVGEEVLGRWGESRGRVQRGFGVVGRVAGWCGRYRSLEGARKLVGVLECCSSWTGLREADAETAGVLLGELGVTSEVGEA